MTTTDVSLRAWVGCLACYNAGRLVGEWVTATDAGECVPCDRAGHDEWWCFDLDGFPAGCGELSPGEAALLARAIEDAASRGSGWDIGPVLAFIANAHDFYMEHVGQLATDFEDAYRGTWDSERDYAEQYADDMCLVPSDDTARYFDYDAFTYDTFCGDHYSISDGAGGVYVFASY